MSYPSTDPTIWDILLVPILAVLLFGIPWLTIFGVETFLDRLEVHETRALAAYGIEPERIGRRKPDILPTGFIVDNRRISARWDAANHRLTAAHKKDFSYETWLRHLSVFVYRFHPWVALGSVLTVYAIMWMAMFGYSRQFLAGNTPGPHQKIFERNGILLLLLTFVLIASFWRGASHLDDIAFVDINYDKASEILARHERAPGQFADIPVRDFGGNWPPVYPKESEFWSVAYTILVALFVIFLSLYLLLYGFALIRGIGKIFLTALDWTYFLIFGAWRRTQIVSEKKRRAKLRKEAAEDQASAEALYKRAEIHEQSAKKKYEAIYREGNDDER